MKRILLLFVTCLFFHEAFSQEDPSIKGYKLKTTSILIKVYQSKLKDGVMLDTPDLTKWNEWADFHYWFKTDIEVDVKGTKYIRITIPSNYRYDPVSESLVGGDDSKNFDSPQAWTKNGLPIDAQDFNSWLWISKTDFDNYKQSFFGNVNGTLIFSALTVPFKYRFKTNGHSSSILNGDLNIGAFAGGRISLFNNSLGINPGVVFGVSSLPMNASNNDSIKGSASQSLMGINYGAAIVLDWQKKFQVGAVFGWDHAVGDYSKGYIYQDKMWIGLSLNFKFLDFGAKDEQTNKKTTK